MYYGLRRGETALKEEICRQLLPDEDTAAREETHGSQSENAEDAKSSQASCIVCETVARWELRRVLVNFGR